MRAENWAVVSAPPQLRHGRMTAGLALVVLVSCSGPAPVAEAPEGARAVASAQPSVEPTSVATSHASSGVPARAPTEEFPATLLKRDRCSTDGWCVQHPTTDQTESRDLEEVWAGGGRLVAVGSSGVVLMLDRAGWRASSKTTRSVAFGAAGPTTSSSLVTSVSLAASMDRNGLQ